MARLSAISLFSGCGGFDYGATCAGLEIIWANDIDKYTYDAYKSILPNVPLTIGDVREVQTFPHADVLIGCYPCTGFSVAARRRWMDNTERDLMQVEGNFLYKEYLRALKQIRPKYFFVENVNGMKSAMNGWFFMQQIEGFRQLGYTPQYKLLNAADYGLAQERKRIFIVGIRDDLTDKIQYSFPEPTHGIHGVPVATLKEAIGDLNEDEIGEYETASFHGHYLTRNRKRQWSEPSFTIVAHSSHVPLHPSGEPMLKIGKDEWKLQGDINRRLSWKECAVLQGLPKHIEPSGALKDKYRVIGNAVPPIFAKEIIKPIIDFESD